MIAKDDSMREKSNLPSHGNSRGSLAIPMTVGLLCWAGISLGFLGLKMLMQHRPEFIGQPARAVTPELLQESPSVVARKVTDDVSVIKPLSPELSEVHFDMKGRRDYRGLRMIRDMSGRFRGRYMLSNAWDEPIFVLLKCPHPRAEGADAESLLAANLKLNASIEGLQENSSNAWFWTGKVNPRTAATVEVSYDVASLRGVTYRVLPQDGAQIKQLRVAFQRQDIPSMRFESNDGTRRPTDELVAWEREDFLAPDFFSASIEESRNLYASLSQLLDIGPLISLLFLLASSAVILARQKLTALQLLTIAAGYALYFPLILYLTANLSFRWALLIAFLVPGVLLTNYARWLLGNRTGLIGGVIFLVLYQIFPTLAVFAGWNRGMVLLCLGVVTLAVLINLQNHALQQQRPAMATLLVALLFPLTAVSQVQVLLPAELAQKLSDGKREPQIALEPAVYEVRQETNFFRVEARVPFVVMRADENGLPLFASPVYLQESKVESDEPGLARLGTITNRLALVAQRSGSGTLRLLYRVPLNRREGKQRVEIPLLRGPSGNVRLDSANQNLEVLSGVVWTKKTLEKTALYEIGVAAEDNLVLQWRDGDPAVTANNAGHAAGDFYGIGLTRAQNLTIVNSDGSCTHFAEFELPASQEEFRMKLPARARLISVSVNGMEIHSPTIEEQLCRVRLPNRGAQQTSHRLSFRLAYPSVNLGFMGTADLALPEVFQTVGTLEWIVALPNGFDTQVVSSGLQIQKSTPDLGPFGDYGRILKSRPHTYLAKDLAPPVPAYLSLRYRQIVAGM